MDFITVLFYIFSALTLVAAISVIYCRNPVYSVLWLIFAFFNSAGLFLLLGAEMLAMLLVIVYVGAVAVLFLFVVMMLNIRISSLKKGFQGYLPLGLLLAAVLLLEIVALTFNSAKNLDINKEETIIEEVEEGGNIKQKDNTNAHQIGRVLYTEYILYFQTSGLILFVAMIGAIVLTLRKREGVRRQDIEKQNDRSRRDAVEIVKVNTGEGVE